jgi:hypothetical protein
MAFIALCAHRTLPAVTDFAFFDDGTAFTGEFVARADAIQAARTDAYNQKSRARVMTGERNAAMERLNTALHEKNAVEHQLNETRGRLVTTSNELHTLYRIREDELSSPRFLARQFWRAFWPRLRARLGGK